MNSLILKKATEEKEYKYFTVGACAVIVYWMKSRSASIYVLKFGFELMMKS